MKAIIATIALLALASPAFAQNEDNTACSKATDDVWVCPKPTHPAGPPKCYVLGGSLVCSGPLAEPTPVPVTKPANCGWNKKGVYVCW